MFFDGFDRLQQHPGVAKHRRNNTWNIEKYYLFNVKCGFFHAFRFFLKSDFEVFEKNELDR